MFKFLCPSLSQPVSVWLFFFFLPCLLEEKASCGLIPLLIVALFLNFIQEIYKNKIENKLFIILFP